MSNGRRALILVAVVAGVALVAVPARATRHQRVVDHAVTERDLSARYPDLGPEMQAYMGFLDAEEAELKHLYDVGEVPQGDYRLQNDRLIATRQAALNVERPRGNDVVPDLYVLVGSELTQILPAGVDAVKGKRAGERLDENWMYHGTIRRGEIFYVLERVGGIGHQTDE